MLMRRVEEGVNGSTGFVRLDVPTVSKRLFQMGVTFFYDVTPRRITQK